MRTRTIFLVAVVTASLADGSVRSQQADVSLLESQRRSMALRFALPEDPPKEEDYLTKDVRNRYPGTFGVDLNYWRFAIANDDPTCKTESGFKSDKCSCKMNWTAVTSNELRYVYLTATDTDSPTMAPNGVDLSFGKLWDDLGQEPLSKALLRGAYHFLRPNTDAATQANVFLKAIVAVDGKRPTQLAPVLDMEWADVNMDQGKPQHEEYKNCTHQKPRKDKHGKVIGYDCDTWAEYNMSGREIAALAGEWIKRVEGATGLRVTIYTHAKWWHDVMKMEGTDLLTNRAIWISYPSSQKGGPSYDGWNGGPKWKMPPFPGGLVYTNPYSLAHFWQFSSVGGLKPFPLTCNGKPTTKILDLNWTPVSGAEFERLFDVQPKLNMHPKQ